MSEFLLVFGCSLLAGCLGYRLSERAHSEHWDRLLKSMDFITAANLLFYNAQVIEGIRKGRRK